MHEHSGRAPRAARAEPAGRVRRPAAGRPEQAVRPHAAGRPVVAGLAGTPPGNALRHLVRLFPQHREREITERLKAVLHRIFWSEGGALQDGFTGGR